MLTSVNLQRKLTSAFTDRQATLLSEVIHDAYSDLVHTGDFNELKELVRQVVVGQIENGQQIKELTTAQQRTEQRLEELASAQKDLTSAQQRTEQRVEELAVAQQRTEQRVDSLTQRVEELTVAQQRTENSVQGLTVAMQETQRSLQALSRQVGGLSDRFGGGVEEAALGIVYFVLTADLGWKVKVLEAGWHKWGEVEVEIDLYGQIFDSQRPDTKIWLFGEAKFNLTTKEVERFAAKVKRVQPHVDGELYPVLFSYRLHPEVLEAIQKAGLHYIGSNGRMK